ncbi:MAG: hypothetical protein ACR2J8_00615 [Thermomicrobiales bacterium]
MTLSRRACAASSALLPFRAAAHRPAPEGETYPRRIVWSGLTWAVKESKNRPVGPGGNRFSSSSRTVWVDPAGQLHLRIERRGAFWRCAEIVAEPAGTFGYGTYAWTLATPVRAIAPHAILGLFTWDSVSNAQANREIDVELGLWPDSPGYPNASFTVQPYTHPGNTRPFPIQPSAKPVTVGFTWSAGQVRFQAAKGPALTPADPARSIATWTRRTADVPTPGREQPRINLWLPDALPPVAGGVVEVVLASFRFTPPA